MSSSRYVRAFQESLATELARLQTHYQTATSESALSKSSGRRRIPLPAAPAQSDAASLVANEIVSQLDERIERLSQVRDWVNSDAELARLIDATIGQQVHAAERRQARLSVVLAVVSLVAGWLISLVGSPAALFAR